MIKTFRVKKSAEQSHELLKIDVKYSFASNRHQKLRTLLDSGATHSIISMKSLSSDVRREIERYRNGSDPDNKMGLKLMTIVFDGPLNSQNAIEAQCVSADLRIQIGDWHGWQTFIITDAIDKESAILGIDFIRRVDFVKVGDQIKLFKAGETFNQALCFAKSKVIIEPRTERMIDVKPTNRTFVNKIVCFESFDYKSKGVLMARSLNKVTPHGFQVLVSNMSDKPVTIDKRHAIGMMTKIESITNESEVVELNSVEMTAERTSKLKPELTADQIAKLNINAKLSASERQQLIDLLASYKNAISWSKYDLGQTDLVEHSIDTGDHEPIRSAPYKQPVKLQEVTHQLVEEMLGNEIIESSRSPWSSPIVLVKKKDGGFRFCVDFRKLNRLTKPDSYPLPRIDNVMDIMTGAKYFTTIDLTSGYWQCRMSEKDKEKTAFVTPTGLYQFRVLAFGLSNGPATYQRLMDFVLKGLTWKKCVVYLDDIIVFSPTFDEHLKRLNQVLARLQKANLKIQPTKCHFALQEVNYLGYKLTDKGLLPNDDRISQIQAMTAPVDKKGVRRFLGTVNYYKRFIPDLARIASPLYRLTENNVRFKWDESAQQSLQRAQEAFDERASSFVPRLEPAVHAPVRRFFHGIGMRAEPAGQQEGRASSCLRFPPLDQDRAPIHDVRARSSSHRVGDKDL